MADSQTTVVLNIGSQKIAVAVFDISKNGELILRAYESDTIVADPAFEASRESQIHVALEEMVGKLKVSKSKVRYAIPSQAVFMRFVKLPPIQQDNLEQLVTFEAQQHVPFPINEVVWDYEMIESGEEKEVVIVAIKADALEDINQTVNDAHLGTAEIDVAPMALYNAYRSSYGVSDEPVLLIDVGAKTSNLVYIEGKHFFTRSVAIGGASITSAIAKEYQISYADAEFQKVTNGIVALGGGHTEMLDESVAALAMVIRNSLSRLPAEIARTTNYYRSQHGGSSPRRVILAGGGANLPYTLEFFEEKLNLPVEFFNPLGGIAIGKGVDRDKLSSDAHTMGELVGLGLRSIGKSSINIDLVPETVEEARAEERRRPFLIAAVAIFLIGMGAFAVTQSMAASRAKDAQTRMTDVKTDLAPFDKDITALQKKEADMSKIAEAYISMEADHAYWFDVLAEVKGAFASDAVWLTDFSPVSNFLPLTGEGDKKPQFQDVVRDDFSSESPVAGKSFIVQPPQPTGPQPKKPIAQNQKPVKLEAKAIHIRGIWRNNPKGQTVVSDLLKNLRDQGQMFSFKNPNGVGMLNDEQILKITIAGEEGDLGFPFELILPLAKPVAIK